MMSSTDTTIPSREKVMVKAPIAFLITLLMAVSSALGFQKKRRSDEDCPKGLFSCVNCSKIENGPKAYFCCFCAKDVHGILKKLSSSNDYVFDELLEKVCSQVTLLKERGGTTPFSFKRKPPLYKLAHQIAKLYLLGELEDAPDAGRVRQVKNLTLGDSDAPGSDLARQIKNLTLETKEEQPMAYDEPRLPTLPIKKERHPVYHRNLRFQPKLDTFLETKEDRHLPPKRTPSGPKPTPIRVPLNVRLGAERHDLYQKAKPFDVLDPETERREMWQKWENEYGGFDTGSEHGPNPWEPKGVIRTYQAGFY